MLAFLQLSKQAGHRLLKLMRQIIHGSLLPLKPCCLSWGQCGNVAQVSLMPTDLSPCIMKQFS